MLDLNSLYRSHFAGLSKWVARRYPALDAEDAVQSAFCRLWQIQDRLTGYTEEDIKRFLFRIVRTKAVSAIRKACAVRRSQQRQGYRETIEIVMGPPQNHAAEVVEQLRIPEADRELLNWRFRDGLTLAEIGERRGTTRHAALEKLQRVLATIRELNPEFA